MILICYDGSDDAKAAIQRTAELLNGQAATVLTVWEPFSIVATRGPMGFGLVPNMPDFAEIDQMSAANALERAEEGAKLAREAGFEAEPRTCSQHTGTSDAILAEAEALDASAIVIGSRGLTGLKSLLLGSVSHGVIQQAARPVIVVPSREVAATRARARRTMGETHEPEEEG